MREPLIMSWRGPLSEGKTYDHPVIQIDIAPTVLAAAGVAAPTDGSMEGVDLMPYLTGKKNDAPHDALIWRLGSQMAVREGDWKLVRYDTAADTPGATSRGMAADVTLPRLYDLSKDLGETDDQFARNPEKVKDLMAVWDAWNAGNIAPAWGAAGGGGTTKAKAKKYR